MRNFYNGFEKLAGPQLNWTAFGKGPRTVKSLYNRLLKQDPGDFLDSADKLHSLQSDFRSHTSGKVLALGTQDDKGTTSLERGKINVMDRNQAKAMLNTSVKNYGRGMQQARGPIPNKTEFRNSIKAMLDNPKNKSFVLEWE